MPVINRLPIGIDNDVKHHKALVDRQCRNDQDKDTSKNLVSLPIGSTLAVQQEDGGPWTHGTIEDKGNHNHHDRSYKICITKTGKIITHNRRHLKPTPISAEHYLHNQLIQHTRTDPLNAIPEHLKKHPPPPNITDTIHNGPHGNSTTHEHKAPEAVQDNNEK